MVFFPPVGRIPDLDQSAHMPFDTVHPGTDITYIPQQCPIDANHRLLFADDLLLADALLHEHRS
jgi:hypothetical protein